MKILKSKILRDLCARAFVALALGAFVFVSGALAWTPPTASPTSGNTNAPLNVSNIDQSKSGGLTLNAGDAEYGLLVPFGKVGIGTSVPTEDLDVAGNISANQAHINQVCGKSNPAQCLTFTQMYNYVHP